MCDPVGLAEIAGRLGVKASTAHVWRYRGLLPAPWRDLAIGPIWDWPVVERWARETGRYADGSAPVDLSPPSGYVTLNADLGRGVPLV